MTAPTYGVQVEVSEWHALGRRGLVKVELTGEFPVEEQLTGTGVCRIRVGWAQLDVFPSGSRTIYLMGPFADKPPDGIHVLAWNIGGEYASPEIPPLALELAARMETLAPPSWPPMPDAEVAS